MPRELSVDRGYRRTEREENRKVESERYHLRIAAAYRIEHKLQPAAATIKKDLFHRVWPPQADSLMRMLDGRLVSKAQ